MHEECDYLLFDYILCYFMPRKSLSPKSIIAQKIPTRRNTDICTCQYAERRRVKNTNFTFCAGDYKKEKSFSIVTCGMERKN